MTRPPLLISFLGYPGSGKTYFARRLAERLPAVLLNTDALRLSMFGSVERIEQLRQTNRSRLYADVFGAMNYAAKQVLKTGQSVIFDAQSSKRRDRQGNHQLATSAGAISLLIWIKTDQEEAIKRGQQREADDDSHRYSAEKMEFLVGRFDKVTELPSPDEHVIEISGQVPFEQQYEIFCNKIDKVYEQANSNR